MSNLSNKIKELMQFFIKTNYEKYLTDNKLTTIPDDQVKTVVESLYSEKKEHLTKFIKNSLKTLYQKYKEDYPGDGVINTILNEIYDDDKMCKNRLITEINLYQQSKKGEKNNYSNLM